MNKLINYDILFSLAFSSSEPNRFHLNEITEWALGCENKGFKLIHIR